MWDLELYSSQRIHNLHSMIFRKYVLKKLERIHSGGKGGLFICLIFVPLHQFKSISNPREGRDLEREKVVRWMYGIEVQ